ncbi:orotate phosphoribosyltransferase [Bacteroides uniformis]|uniref:orotate phosphoribosyltransferase n=1 Tax=Bacteroides uniformis TaxID=820 RepID=UPI0039B6097B
MERLVILLLLILILVTRYGRRKLGEAYCAAAKYAPTLELRRDFSRKAVLAGNREARKIFPITVARFAADHQPLKVFKRKKIPCVFTDYYFPSRYNPYLSEAQKQFCQSILDFKDGKHDGIRFLVAGIERLKPQPGTIVMFMPCSTQRKYWRRFKTMADYVHDEYPELVCGISYVRYTGDRESLHLQKDRGNVTLEKNYFFKEDLAGKEVLVVDDILTTGNIACKISERKWKRTVARW